MRIEPSITDALSSGPSSEDGADLKRMAQEFEATLMAEILRNLSDSVSGDDEEDAFGGALSGVLWLEMTRELTAERQLGLAEALAQQLSRDREAGIAPSLPSPISPMSPVEAMPAAPLSTSESFDPRGPIAPVAGTVSSRFGSRVDPYEHREKFHGGLDVAASEGTTVNVTAPGRVVFAGHRGDYGNVVIVEHSRGVRTLYAHLSRIDVSAGAEIRGGQKVGAVGSTGRATGPHLHFEVSEGGTRVDPEAWLARRS